MARSLSVTVGTTNSFTPTSVGINGHRIAEMWGGDGNGSWINTPMPAVTSVAHSPIPEGQTMPQGQDSAAAVQTLLDHIYGTVPGTAMNAYPVMNIDSFSATINVVDSATTPLVPLRITYTEGGVVPSWAYKVGAQLLAGVPIPAGLEPLPPPDTDSTLVIYDPDWSWPGDPTKAKIGKLWELWMVRSPSQNAAAGKAAEWTCGLGYAISGVNVRPHAHAITRLTGDALSQAHPSMWAPAIPQDPRSALSGTAAGYWGHGPGGLAEDTTFGVVAAKLSYAHQLLRISDFRNGVINHPMGIQLFYQVGAGQGAAAVWPATLQDYSSRPWMRHGSRFRLPANYVSSYPAGMPVGWRPLFDMFIQCFRDYGALFLDTTGASFCMRGEPGLKQQPGWPSDWDSNRFIKYLPWASMELLATGSDANYYP